MLEPTLPNWPGGGCKTAPSTTTPGPSGRCSVSCIRKNTCLRRWSSNPFIRRETIALPVCGGCPEAIGRVPGAERSSSRDIDGGYRLTAGRVMRLELGGRGYFEWLYACGPGEKAAKPGVWWLGWQRAGHSLPTEGLLSVNRQSRCFRQARAVGSVSTGSDRFCSAWDIAPGVQVSPMPCWRTFATMSLRAGMNLLHLQGLLGHSTIEMTRRYVQMLDDDLVEAHRAHGPIDTFLHQSQKE